MPLAPLPTPRSTLLERWNSREGACGHAGSGSSHGTRREGVRTSRMSEGLGSLRGSTTWSLQDGTAGGEARLSPRAPAPSPPPPRPPPARPSLGERSSASPNPRPERCRREAIRGEAELIAIPPAEYRSKPEPLQEEMRRAPPAPGRSPSSAASPPPAASAAAQVLPIAGSTGVCRSTARCCPSPALTALRDPEEISREGGGWPD